MSWRVHFSFEQLLSALDFHFPMMMKPVVEKKDTSFREKLRLSDPNIPSNLNLAFKEMISDSGELCETEVRLLHIQLIGTSV